LLPHGLGARIDLLYLDVAARHAFLKARTAARGGQSRPRAPYPRDGPTDLAGVHAPTNRARLRGPPEKDLPMPISYVHRWREWRRLRGVVDVLRHCRLDGCPACREGMRLVHLLFALSEEERRRQRVEAELAALRPLCTEAVPAHETVPARVRVWGDPAARATSPAWLAAVA
jgi:hypothetical protein